MGDAGLGCGTHYPLRFHWLILSPRPHPTARWSGKYCLAASHEEEEMRLVKASIHSRTDECLASFSPSTRGGFHLQCKTPRGADTVIDSVCFLLSKHNPSSQISHHLFPPSKSIAHLGQIKIESIS